MRYARIAGGVVAETLVIPDDLAIGDVVAPDVAATMAEAPAEIEPGWLYDGQSFAPAPVHQPSLAERRAAVIAAIDGLRRERIDAGAPAYGLRIAIDDGARADMGAMATTALAAAGGAVPWPPAYALGWITVTNERIALDTPADGLALAALVGAYYAGLVQHARSLKDAVLAADGEALDGFDIEAGWPGVGDA